ncbi:MAG: hypothetical protein Q9190_005261 [Brigantiaea leucoxantha]
MTVLAVYYTLADVILLAQCFYYRGFTLSDPSSKLSASLDDEEAVEDDPSEESPLLGTSQSGAQPRFSASDADHPRRSSSFSSFRGRLCSVDATHLSPATPLVPPPKPTADPPTIGLKSSSVLRSVIFNVLALFLVCAAGILGWFLSTHYSKSVHNRSERHDYSPAPMAAVKETEEMAFDLWGQMFGYTCAILYLGSRIPQLLLNHRRKSTEGVSMLFFLFACVGNLTYVMSILAYEPDCAKIEAIPGIGILGHHHREWEAFRDGCTANEWKRQYGRYILINASWLAGSAGTLILDLMVFAQFWIYRNSKGS